MHELYGFPPSSGLSGYHLPPYLDEPYGYPPYAPGPQGGSGRCDGRNGTRRLPTPPPKKRPVVRLFLWVFEIDARCGE